MKTPRLWYIGMVVALVAGCQTTDVVPRTKPLAYKPDKQSSAKTAAAGKQHEGQQTGFSAPLAAPKASNDSDASDDPSTLEKLSTGTQGIITRAGQALSPKNNNALGKSGISSSSSRQTQSKKQKKPKKPSAFYTWLHPEPKRPRTLTEWMAQPRLDP